jgi:hypothetical protein
LVGNKNPYVGEKYTLRQLHGKDRLMNAVFTSENFSESLLEIDSLLENSFIFSKNSADRCVDLKGS